MNNQVQIAVKRMIAYSDLLRAYKIKMDGVVVGSVGAREAVSIFGCAGPRDW